MERIANKHSPDFVSLHPDYPCLKVQESLWGSVVKGTYSRCEDDDVLIWHVETLWRLAKDLPVKTVTLASITNFDEVCWFSPESEKPTCKAVAVHARRIHEADLTYPIILSASGILMDGMHRVAKAWMLDMEEIHAVQFLADPQPDRILPVSAILKGATEDAAAQKQPTTEHVD